MLISAVLTIAALALGPVHTPSAASGPPWVAPVGPPTRITRGFDRPVPNWLPGHRGVDLAASLGQPVKAAGAGVVIWAGTIAGRGVVVISHSDGLRTTYEPVTASVALGEPVRGGEVIGRISHGQSHCDGHCLHWGLRRGLDYLNPLLLLGLGRPRLIPLISGALVVHGREPGPKLKHSLGVHLANS
jgi:murein DD-endopeptidase MepM/ murein hydrolase activator NlpD